MADPRLSDWVPRPRPARVTLSGQWCRLEPLDPVRHGDALFAASMAPGAEDRFRYLWNGPEDRAGFDHWLHQAASTDDPLFHAVVDPQTGRAEGRQALMRMAPEHGVVEIGHILFGPALARTRAATESLFLTAQYVFDTLGYRRFEWKCDARNLPSRKAAVRFGFVVEGVFQQHMVIKGRNRDTMWFAMLDRDWQVLKPLYEAWLDPANFDEHGQQRMSLQTSRPRND
jgi:RimJ/RimL family protein N-acetyltransferase